MFAKLINVDTTTTQRVRRKRQIAGLKKCIYIPRLDRPRVVQSRCLLCDVRQISTIALTPLFYLFKKKIKKYNQMKRSFPFHLFPTFCILHVLQLSDFF